MKFAYHTAWILFWMTKSQAIITGNDFILKRKLKEKRKSHEPFQSYLLTGQADSVKKAG